MHRVSAPVAPPSRTTASRLTASKYSSNLARSWPPSASPNPLDHGLQLYLQTRSITASNCNSKLARSRPPGASPNSLDHGLQVHLQTRSITASKFARSWPPKCISLNSLDHGLQVHLQTRSITASQCISKLSRSRPPTIFPNTLDYGLQVHLQTCSIIASECISEFTRSRCGEMVELEGRQPIINTPPHLTWHPKGILEKERFLLEERRKRVRGYAGIPGHDELHKLRGSMNAWKECMRNHTNCVGL